MNKKIFVFIVFSLLIFSVSAKEVVNVSSSFNPDFIAGNSEEIIMNFKYPSELGFNNELASSLFVKVSISSKENQYPVWKGDFDTNGVLEQSYLYLTEEVNLTCFENYYIDFNYSTGDYYNISNVDNGTFYCYDPLDFLTTLKPDLSSKLNISILPKKNLYPGEYNITISLLELVVSDLKIITENLGEDCGNPNGCNGADTNGDGVVDDLDIENWELHLGAICSEDEAWCYGADIDRDGVVNSSKDLLIIQEYWENTSCSELNDWCENADIDKSGVVDSVDLARFVKYKNYDRCNPFGPWCDGADVNRDGFVDGNIELVNETEGDGGNNNNNGNGGGGSSGGNSNNDNNLTNISYIENCSEGYVLINGSCVLDENYNFSDFNNTYSPENDSNGTTLQTISWRNQTLLSFMTGAATGIGEFGKENFGFVVVFLILVSGSVGYVVWVKRFKKK